jgi:hypothetical protein
MAPIEEVSDPSVPMRQASPRCDAFFVNIVRQIKGIVRVPGGWNGGFDRLGQIA